MDEAEKLKAISALISGYRAVAIEEPNAFDEEAHVYALNLIRDIEIILGVTERAEHEGSRE